MKIELSWFSGDDPFNWLALVKEYLDYMVSTPPTRSRWWAFISLVMRLCGSSGINCILDPLYRPPSPNVFYNAFGRVTNWTSTYPSLMYPKKDFSRPMLMISLGVFLGGLKMDLQNDVLDQAPYSLACAIELACIYDN